MPATVTFFPVGNGDMTLITLDNRQTILIDVNIRGAADDPEDETPDVAQELKDRLKRDSDCRRYVDVMLLSHPDTDHCTGLQNHFHLGPLDTWNEHEDKIVIREMWSSPIIFRRASKEHTLCDDAKAWAAEARRRVKLFKDEGTSVKSGDRIIIVGEDEGGKTDDIPDIVLKLDEIISQADRVLANAFEARLLGPLPPTDDEDEEDKLRKNQSSVILRFSLSGDGYRGKGYFLTGGDAEVAIWDELWQKHGKSNPEWFEYDILQTPHHCSWRSLSYDSWSLLGEKVKVNHSARSALSQTRDGAVIVASCKAIRADDDNPPHERAKREYVSIVDGQSDRFFCTGEYPSESRPEPLEFSVTATGPEKRRKSPKAAAVASLGIGGIAQQARAHGKK